MIELERLNNTIFFLNPELIYMAEETPDTVITLINGERLLVKQSIKELRQRFIEYKQKTACGPPILSDSDIVG